MERIIIIDDEGIQQELRNFLTANRDRIKFESGLDEINDEKAPLLDKIMKDYNESRKVVFESNGKIIAFDQNQILMIREGPDESEIILASGEVVPVLMSLSRIEKYLEKLPFVRIHKKYIVNIHAIKTISYNEKQPLLTLTSGDIVPISSTVKTRLMKILEQYL